MNVTVGATAPLFQADGTGSKQYRLEDQRGNIVVLVFYPGDNTPVCTRQLTSYSEAPTIVERPGVVTWAISPQDVESHEAFAEANKLTMPLLYDKDKTVARQFNVLGPLGFYRRSVFVIDPAGVVRYAKRTTAGLGYPSAKAIEDVITKIEAEFNPLGAGS